MNHETIAAWCEGLPGAEATAPFGPDNVVYKVGGRMFAILSLELPRVNLKGDPENNRRLRERTDAVEPGYHMDKRHWVSVYWERGGVDADELHALIRGSYDLIVAKLPRATRDALGSEAA